jgi:hypothetical protein
MKKNRKIAKMRNLPWAGLALITVLAVIVAPICAPLCIAASCASGGHAGRAEAHCQRMSMHENGPRAEVNHGQACGSSELAATLNEATHRMDDRQNTPVRIAPGEVQILTKILVSGTSARNPSGLGIGSEMKLKSSSIAILKI